ncbi:MAG: prolyl oligopeptidase family serine peptidase [archaeon]|nr:prolyl oligopeptidase family serine peptidase [archaeon]
MKIEDFQVIDENEKISTQLRVFNAETNENKEFFDVCVIITHPHPLMGGSMMNNVVLGISDYFSNKGIMSAIFNFRGIGRSSGNFDDGIGEQQDLINVTNFILNKYSNIKRIFLVGYSFGATVTLAAANRIKNAFCVSLISYPFKLLSEIKPNYDLNHPILFINGKKDQIAGIDRFYEEYEKFNTIKSKFVLENVNHFYFRSEEEISSKIFEFLKENY